jgi:hypothetical protein
MKVSHFVIRKRFGKRNQDGAIIVAHAADALRFRWFAPTATAFRAFANVGLEVWIVWLRITTHLAAIDTRG